MITIVGIGALGSHVALMLRNLKQGLKVVDFDRVEQKNTQAQFHTKMSLGRNKAEALAQAFRGMFGIEVTAIPYRMTGDNAIVTFKGSELVIDCTDNYAARMVISTACRKIHLPCLHGALAASGDFARIVWEDSFIPDQEGEGAGATCVDGHNLPFYNMAAGVLAVEAQRFLETGKKMNFQLSKAAVINW